MSKEVLLLKEKKNNKSVAYKSKMNIIGIPQLHIRQES